MLKSYKRRRLHRKLEDQIEFNNKRIHEFKTITVENSEILLSPPIEICMSYSKRYLNKIVRKYDVDIDLVIESERTAEEAIEEFEAAEMRYYEYKNKLKRRRKLDLYKEAIMELKEEGLL